VNPLRCCFCSDCFAFEFGGHTLRACALGCCSRVSLSCLFFIHPVLRLLSYASLRSSTRSSTTGLFTALNAANVADPFFSYAAFFSA
jgi:hypothetical protein